MNDADELELRLAIRLRLGPDAISKTCENVSTNKYESMTPKIDQNQTLTWPLQTLLMSAKKRLSSNFLY